MGYEEILKKLDRYSTFKEDWDSYGAIPIDSEIINATKNLVKKLPSGLKFYAVPGSNGNIHLEFKNEPRSLELEIENPVEIYWNKWYNDYRKDEMDFGKCSIEDLAKIEELIDWFKKGEPDANLSSFSGLL